VFLAGLIWTIQIVHYPSFYFVEEYSFKEFIAFHSKRISQIVIPLMFLELLTAVFLCFIERTGFFYINLVLVVFIWTWTFLVSAPCHNNLAQSKEKKEIKKLVQTNWVRTALWSLKVVLLFGYLQGRAFEV
jgi:hypothetical protein